MKKVFLICFIFFACNNMLAQQHNAIWIFGDSAGINFSNPNVPTTFSSGMDGRGSVVTYADSAAQLQFYVWSYVLWLRNYVFTNQNILLDSVTSGGGYQEVAIIPFLKNKHKFYILQNGVRGYVDHILKSVIDMSLNNGLGAVIEHNTAIDNYGVADCLIAIKHGNGRDWWMITKYADPNSTQYNRFYVYAIIEDSIYAPIIQNFNNATDADFQKICFNSDGTKLYLLNVGGFLAVYDFDRCTGLLSNEQIIFPEQTWPFNRIFWEAALSRNDSVLYISTSPWGPIDHGYLIQYDLSDTNIASSADTLETFYPPIGAGALRLAPDNKIYFSRAYESPTTWSYPYPDSMRNYINENLSVINNPNALGVACNYTPFSFYLGGKRTYYGLPNNPNYSLGRLLGSPCDTLQWVGTPETPKPPLGGFRSLRINPNPFTSIVNIELSNFKNDNWQLKIVDAMGQEILLQNIVKENTEIDFRYLSSGIYFVMVVSDTEVVSSKIVKL